MLKNTVIIILVSFLFGCSDSKQVDAPFIKQANTSQDEAVAMMDSFGSSMSGYNKVDSTISSDINGPLSSSDPDIASLVQNCAAETTRTETNETTYVVNGSGGNCPFDYQSSFSVTQNANSFVGALSTTFVLN